LRQFLGIIRDGTFLLQTYKVPPTNSHPADAQRLREAERYLDIARRSWAQVYPDSRLDIMPLSRVDGNGWEIERGRGH
jgi:hypothetical protein